jgi:hypothetical protein
MTSIMLSAASRPTLAKNARMGHPRSDMGKEEKTVDKGGPPAQATTLFTFTTTYDRELGPWTLLSPTIVAMGSFSDICVPY